MTYLCNGKEENERFRMHGIYGRCLEKAGICIPEGAIATVDMNAEIEVGDLVICSRMTGQVIPYIKKVKEINGDSIIVGTAYLDRSRDFTFEAAEISGVVKEIYRKDTCKRIYVRPERGCTVRREVDILILKNERLKAEVSELRAEVERLQNERIERIRELTRVVYDKEIAEIKSEARKEFAERLKCGVPQETGVIRCADIDRTMAEMESERG